MAKTTPATLETPERLGSLDAYRGFVMLAMASSAFSFMTVLKTRDQVLNALQGTRFEAYSKWWDVFYRRLCYQFDHVYWTGCSFWDLIQPSFMFMVGVALPFSFSRRQAEGQSEGRWFAHVLLRSLILVLLGIFLSSTNTKLTDFTFVNVLTQIGLGYPVLCLLHACRWRTLLAAIVVILGAYWAAFAVYEIPESEREAVTSYIQERRPEKYQVEWKAVELTGFASHWNMHTNFAAAVDRWFLNLFPRNPDVKDGEELPPWRGRGFWINNGGYQTLNFIPSLATMIFGLMAGQLLRSTLSPGGRIRRLLLWGGLCFVVAMAADTTIWPMHIEGCDWSICPAVKRIWTPTWAVFSTGWCFVLLATFYGVIDVWKWKRWSWPLAVVGMNSIAIYCMAQTMKGWLGKVFLIHARTIDSIPIPFTTVDGVAAHTQIVPALTSETAWTAPILMRLVEVTLLWLICVWLYRRRIFVRI